MHQVDVLQLNVLQLFNSAVSKPDASNELFSYTTRLQPVQIGSGSDILL